MYFRVPLSLQKRKKKYFNCLEICNYDLLKCGNLDIFEYITMDNFENINLELWDFPLEEIMNSMITFNLLYPMIRQMILLSNY